MAKKQTLTKTLVDAARALGFEKVTVDKLDSLNIPRVRELSPKEIRAIRVRMNASQGVFARYLNVNPSTVQKWEQGAVRPQNAALKLLNLIHDKGIEILIDERR
jgi:putative transcriptional regulator